MSNRKLSRPVIYALVAAAALAAYFLLPEDVTRRGRPRTNPKTSASAKLPEGFTDADLKAKFEPVNIAVRDAFVPLVIRSGGAETAAAPDAVPSVLTGGDPNWYFTGMVEIDGVPMALIENKVSGEGAFVKHSEAWKAATVTGIHPYSLTLAGKDGKTYTLTISQAESSPAMMAQGFMPVNPPLRGNISNGLTVEPSNARPRERQNVAAGNPASNNEARDGEN